jgi:hypothetical protein
MIKLRTYIFINALQPQLTSYMGTVSQGFLPVPGDACLWIEVAPGMAVHRLTDIALKGSNVHLGQQIVERAYGSMVIHHRDQSGVLESGQKVLDYLKTDERCRQKCHIMWNEIIRAITPDHAVLINRDNRRGSMILPGQSMYILETEPAGYIVYAANEADINVAAQAATQAIENLTGC